MEAMNAAYHGISKHGFIPEENSLRLLAYLPIIIAPSPHIGYFFGDAGGVRGVFRSPV